MSYELFKEYAKYNPISWWDKGNGNMIYCASLTCSKCTMKIGATPTCSKCTMMIDISFSCKALSDNKGGRPFISKDDYIKAQQEFPEYFL